tara:strand:+ start:2393 stop:3571 length:1179 start_codon:yes stop_codon:yes gene_type:complete
MPKTMRKKINNKLKILRIITSLNPKFGGPATGIIESSKDLILKGHNVTILTLDKDTKNSFNINKIKIINFKNYIGENYKFSFNFFYWLLRKHRIYDHVIVHGIWQFPSLAARLILNGKYFVFTHGQLDPYFSLNWLKKIKKQFYWFLIERQNLVKCKSILLTSKGEKKSLKNTFVNCNGIKKKVINYGIIKPTLEKKKNIKLFYKKIPSLKNKKFFLFLGRFDEKKGCEILIKSIFKLKNKFDDKVLLAGPGFGGKYQVFLERLVNKYKLNDKILFSGPLYKELKWGSIMASECMLLSSHGENFGISLVESLSVSVPVITTDKVNISNEILNSGAGLISKNTVSGFSNNLLKFIQFNKKQKLYMSQQALKCFENNFNISSNKKTLSNLLLKK